jgi:hypothetical protein
MSRSPLADFIPLPPAARLRALLCPDAANAAPAIAGRGAQPVRLWLVRLK